MKAQKMTELTEMTMETVDGANRCCRRNWWNRCRGGGSSISNSFNTINQNGSNNVAIIGNNNTVIIYNITFNIKL